MILLFAAGLALLLIGFAHLLFGAKIDKWLYALTAWLAGLVLLANSLALQVDLEADLFLFHFCLVFFFVSALFLYFAFILRFFILRHEKAEQIELGNFE